MRYKDQPFHRVVLEPVAKPTSEQIQLLREVSLLSFDNLLEIRKVLLAGGHECFGPLLIAQAEALSSRLIAVGIPHRVEKTAEWRIESDLTSS